MQDKKKQYKEVLNAGKFFLILIVVFAVLSIITGFFPRLFFEGITAGSSSAVLNATGITNTLEAGIEMQIKIIGENNPVIVINDLCTGIMEAIILVAAIIATFEIKLKKRIFGAVAAIIAIFLFNQFRILLTTLFILSAPIELVVLSHDILFRLFLFIVIVVFYGTWLYWGHYGFNAKKIRKLFARAKKKE